MKKLLLICMLAAAMVLAGSVAWAYDYTQYTPAPNGTPLSGYTNPNPIDEVASYLGTSAYGYSQTNFLGPNWGLQIGDSNFAIGGANVVKSGGSTYLDIYTGWGTNPTAEGSYSNGLLGNQYSEYGAVAADLTLYSKGNMWMVRLDSSGAGELFLNPKYYTSYGLFQAVTNTYGGNTYGSLIYGAYYNSNNAHIIPVWATSGLVSGTTVPVSWIAPGYGGNSTSYYEVTIDLSAISGLNPSDFQFLYSTATCANGLLTNVPLPPSALLLGSGLLGLLGLRWKWSLKT
jgi:hypothetical protein